MALAFWFVSRASAFVGAGPRWAVLKPGVHHALGYLPAPALGVLLAFHLPRLQHLRDPLTREPQYPRRLWWRVVVFPFRHGQQHSRRRRSHAPPSYKTPL